MDIHMPVMNVLEATRRIRASADGTQTRIVDLTAHALVRLDVVAVNRMIEETNDHDSTLAEALAVQARDLQFGQILQLIRVNHNVSDTANDSRKQI
jgi:CheY-like chemotaxis protein